MPAAITPNGIQKWIMASTFRMISPDKLHQVFLLLVQLDHLPNFWLEFSANLLHQCLVLSNHSTYPLQP
jgi:hypothetical protein